MPYNIDNETRGKQTKSKQTITVVTSQQKVEVNTMNERLEQAKTLLDIAAKMREVSGDILAVYEAHEISYAEFMQMINSAQDIMNTATSKAHKLYDEIVFG